MQTLEGLEAVHKRPSTYIGSATSQGLHHMVHEIMDNAVDEALAGHYTRIEVSPNEDGSITIRDSGRGIPTDVQKKAGPSAIQVVFTVLHAGDKSDSNSYKVPGGLHGVGISVISILSRRLGVQMDRDGCSYAQSHVRGVPLDRVHILCSCADQEHGTTVTFRPDREVLPDCSFDFRTLMLHPWETVFLTSGLEIILCDRTCADDIGSNVCCFCYQNGLRDFISFMNDGQPTLYSSILYGQWGTEDIQAELASIYNTSYEEELLSFVNNISTPGDGAHVSDFRQAPTRVIDEYARKQGLLRECDSSLSRDRLSEGMMVIVSVCLEDPQFEGQTKQRLGSGSARPVVDRLVYEKITLFLEQNPQVAKAILNKAALVKKVRAATRSARDLARRKTALIGLTPPGKLVDCSGCDPRECGLFIMEEDSAGGSAKMARRRESRAMLPLRGKVLNTGKTSLDKVCVNTEIKAMISAFGVGTMGSFSLEELRYHKIILVTDADVDGAHIIALLLAFLFRYIPKPIEAGHVYLIQPPLHWVEKEKKLWHAYSGIELARILDDIDKDGTNKIQRYKGPGEMDVNQLWGTAMDPAYRILLRVGPEEGADASDLVSGTGRTFSTLMGDDVEPRKNYTLEHAQYIIMLDVQV